MLRSVCQVWIVLVIVLFTACQSGPPARDARGLVPVEPAIEGVLAVNYFADVQADAAADTPDWLSRSITDFLISELSGLDFISVTSRSMVRDVLREQEFALLSGLTEETTEFGRILEADYVFTGDYQVRDGLLTINARLLDVETAEIVRAFRAAGPESSLHHLQERILYEFLSFANVPLRTEQLAARDYDADTASIRRFYRAEVLAEQDREAEARQELEQLLAENPLFTPASERLRGETAGSGMMIDGRAAVAAADEETRRQLYFRNLTRSFALYTQANAYCAEVTDVTIDSGDARMFQVHVEGSVFFREGYRTVLEEFLEVNPYLTPESRASYERFLRHGGFSLDAAYLFFLKSAPVALSPEDNYYGFIRLNFRDASGDVFLRVDSNHVRGEYPVYARGSGESGYNDGDHGIGWMQVFTYAGNYTGSGAMNRLQAFAALGGDLRAPFYNGLWLGQVKFEIVLELPRSHVETLAEVTAEPYFGRVVPR